MTFRRLSVSLNGPQRIPLLSLMFIAENNQYHALVSQTCLWLTPSHQGITQCSPCATICCRGTMGREVSRYVVSPLAHVANRTLLSIINLMFFLRDSRPLLHFLIFSSSRAATVACLRLLCSVLIFCINLLIPYTPASPSTSSWV